MKKPVHINAKRWFSTNTYHSCYVTFDDGSEETITKFSYGYGEQYISTAIKWFIANGYVTQAQHDAMPYETRFLGEVMNVTWTVSDVKRKKDL